MVTILSAQGLRFVIFLDDHEPAHAHVFGDGADGPALIWADGMKRGDIRKAMTVVAERQDEFLRRWRRIHGQSS